MSEEAAPLVEPVLSEEEDVTNIQFLQEKITHGVELAKGALEEAKQKVLEYDTASAATDKAGAFLAASMEKAQTAVSELGATTHSLKEAGEIPVKAFSGAIAKASAAVTALVDAAKQYDDKYHLSEQVTAAISGPREQAAAALASVAAYVSAAAAAASAQLQGVSAGVRAKLICVATGALDRAIPAAAKADEKLHVTEKGQAATTALLSKLKELDERFGVTAYVAPIVTPMGEKAQALDQKVTGGKLSPALAQFYQAGVGMVGQMRDQFTEKKKELHAEAEKTAE